jgi:Fic family protein
MNPPYELTPRIISLISSVSMKLGEVNANHLTKQSPLLRKQNRIKTIHASLNLEGNTLTEEQITAIIEKKRVIGPEKDILEVMNAVKVYELFDELNPFSMTSYLKAHKILMYGLIHDAGLFRTKGVGIVKGDQIKHVAPPARLVPQLMKDLFAYLKNKEENTLIKSCVFHYEMEFIHPFNDGNGRMGRLWQTLILKREFPVFEYLPFESLIHKTQRAYYKALADSDKTGKSTPFIEYMLQVLDDTLAELLRFNNRVMTDLDRLEYFIQTHKGPFTRKDYMNVFKSLSPATASRDLLKGTELKLLKKKGDKRKTVYEGRGKMK